MKESRVERLLVECAQSLGYLHYKFTSPGKRGVPDRLFVRPGGGTLFLEIKAAGKKPEAHQKREMQKLRDMGAAVGWCDNYFDGEHCLITFYTNGRHPDMPL